MTQEEFKDEVRRLRPRLVQTARRYLSDDDAEDTVQDALLRLWQMVDQLHAPFDNLAIVLTRHLCIDHLRRQHPTLPQTDQSDDNDSGDDERTERMMRIISTLPSLQQTVLRMRHIEGMEMREIASLTGSSEVAIRKTLSRARQTIRRRLAAAVVAALVAGGAAILLTQLGDDECVAYIYGKRVTDRTVVLKEMQQTMSVLSQEDGDDAVETQLKNMFGKE